MTLSLEKQANIELLKAQRYQTLINTVNDGVVMAIEQGIWITLSIDMFAISQRLNEKDHKFLWDQRNKMVETLGFITDKNVTIGFLSGTVPNPLSYAFRFLKPLKTELGRTEIDENGVTHYKRLDPIPMLLMVFTVPAILRIIANQIGEIIPM